MRQGPAGNHVILGMNFKKAYVGPSREDLDKMFRFEANPGTEGHIPSVRK